MKKKLMLAVLAAALAPCLAATAGGTFQQVDMTNPDGNCSQICDTGTALQFITADDWKCSDGLSIKAVRWYGWYQHYLDTQDGPVSAPTSLQPTEFILKRYADDGGAPGKELGDAHIPLADCMQAYAGTAKDINGFYYHMFHYQAVLPAAWNQDKGSIYWLSVVAHFAVSPDLVLYGFTSWNWATTNPGDFLGTGHELNFMGSDPWAPLHYLNPPHAGMAMNFAFEIGALPVSVKANKTTFKRSGEISVTADVAKTGTPCWPFVRIRQPNGELLYLDQSRGFVAEVAPYLGIKTGPIALPDIPGYPILQNAQFRDMPAGTYVLEGGAVDTATTDINDLKYVGVVSGQALSVEE